MLSRLRAFTPRPLYIATVAFGLAAGFSATGWFGNKSDDAWIAETMRAQNLRDRREVLIVAALESRPKIDTLSADDQEVLRSMLHDKGVRGVIACSILASFTSASLMRDYVAPLSEFCVSDPKNTIIPWTLSRWRDAGGADVVRQIASESGPLAVAAKESEKR